MGPSAEHMPLEPYPVRTFEDDIETAKLFRKCLDEESPGRVCCVCACAYKPGEVVHLPESSFLPETGGYSHLLTVAWPKGTAFGPRTQDESEREPRWGHTSMTIRGEAYCVSKLGVAGTGAKGDPYGFTVCSSCNGQLSSGAGVPPSRSCASTPGCTPTSPASWT